MDAGPVDTGAALDTASIDTTTLDVRTSDGTAHDALPPDSAMDDSAVLGDARDAASGCDACADACAGCVPTDTTAPTVSLTNPAVDTTYASPQTVTLTATATDDVGVTRVEFYDGATLLGTATSAPYQYRWSFVVTRNGVHTWTARAYDAAGNSSTSSPLNLTVAIPPDDYYFYSDFDGIGVDTYRLTGWGIRANGMVVDDYLENDPPYSLQAIALDPEGTGRSVLRSQSVNDSPDPGTSRAQYTADFGDTVFLDVYHTSHRVWFSPDLALLSNFPGGISARGVPDWITIYEMWNGYVPTWDGDVGGSCRWSFGLHKEAGTGQSLRFEIAAEYMQPDVISYTELWPLQVNTTAEVPLGQWVTIDMDVLRGEGPNGRLKITVTPDGGTAVTIFDISNHTIYPGHPEIPLHHLQPFKLYASDTILDFFTAGTGLYAYYNDFIWYRN